MLALMLVIPTFKLLVADINSQDADIDSRKQAEDASARVSGKEIIDHDRKKQDRQKINQLTPKIKVLS